MLLPGVLPVIVTLPEPVDVMQDSCPRLTPLASGPVPHEVPLIVIDPELVVTLDKTNIQIPSAISVPFAAVPVIVTLPVPVDDMLPAYEKMPLEKVPVQQELPMTASAPLLVVILEP